MLSLQMNLFFEIYAHVIRLLYKKNSILQTDRGKKATEQDFVNEAWTPILTTIFNNDEHTLKWGDSVSQISAVAKKRALPEEDVLGDRIDLRVLGKNNDMFADEFANSKLGPFKFSSDHLKLLRESKIMFDNIANQKYISGKEVRRRILGIGLSNESTIDSEQPNLDHGQLLEYVYSLASLVKEHSTNVASERKSFYSGKKKYDSCLGKINPGASKTTVPSRVSSQPTEDDVLPLPLLRGVLPPLVPFKVLKIRVPKASNMYILVALARSLNPKFALASDIQVSTLVANSLDGEVKIMKLFSPGLYTVQHLGSIDIPTNVNHLKDLRKKIIPRLNYVKNHMLKNANILSNSLDKETRKKKKRSNSYQRSSSYDDVEVGTRWTRGTWFPSRKPNAPIMISSDLL
ncbi:hypothetical protein INT47_004548 [Mucor saturninus]|uniref:Uncharacterized protein n=1 Tax=Mucor saturninus TaxID=64648 RepID=A0A8H7RLJ6_9FUNG|nr:hypothetical protein INT47_004548 [Mucor saturninus]